jgi:hypothetical protein
MDLSSSELAKTINGKIERRCGLEPEEQVQHTANQSPVGEKK